ncbi:MAG: ATP-binding protein [Bryobacterales bacterium]|nr:ATP-binding protein [Bryobacterales bacterium]
MTYELSIRNVGPVQQADLRMGDLTVLVGPQATGKSICLQFLKLLLDTGPVLAALRKSGLDWDRKWVDFLDVYFGEGMRGIWHAASSVRWLGKDVDFAELVRPKQGKAVEKCFFIPAQRVLALSREGWLRPFSEYRPGDPFIVREFSEKLRIQMEAGFGGRDLFPQPGRLKSEIRRLLKQAVFSGFHLQVEKHGAQKRLVLSEEGNRDGKIQTSLFSSSLPFMVWSAGQREFVPLLLGLYWLMPPSKVGRRGSLKWVVIEELEMGLHPKAIEAMLVIVLDLVARGYRVCISTHSPQVLDLVWALRVFRQNQAKPADVLRMFGVRATPGMLAVGKAALHQETRVYYFDRPARTAVDISNLDPASGIPDEAGWGGLTEFSSRVQDEVARVVNRGRE